MSTEDNKNLVRRLFTEVVNEGRMDVLGELVADKFVGRSPAVGTGVGGTIEGIGALTGEVTALRTMLPDLQVQIEQLVAEADRVAVRGVTRGRHTGAFADIPPSGRDVTMTWAAIYRIADGKIAERWLNADDLSSFRQLGIIPPQ